jgi:hypothetical protein
MSSENAADYNSIVTKLRAKSPLSFDLTFSVNQETANGLMEEVQRVVGETVREELSAHFSKLNTAKVEQNEMPAQTQTNQGLELPPGEPLRAKDLRTALLLGKIPENAGLLIDRETTAQLLSVSYRTLCRLVDEKGVPAPVRISGRVLRGRLSELLE